VGWPPVDRHRRSPHAGIPDFNAYCTLEIAAASAQSPTPTG
jgi:hypothetical protein